MRTSARVWLLVLLGAMVLGAGCGEQPPASVASGGSPAPPRTSPSSRADPVPPSPAAGSVPDFFRDVTRAAGMTFVHQQGTNLIYMPDTSSPGVGIFDFDGDGFSDVFLLQGCGPEHTHDVARMPPSHFYRTTISGGDPHFEEIGDLAGLANRGWGQSCLAWDFDNDGYEDLMLSQYQEPQKLYRNNGDGTFREVAHEQGVAGEDLVWASSLTALDFDLDGFLDVYVGQYLRFENKDWVKDPPMDDSGAGLSPRTVVPGRYPPLPKRLFRNMHGSPFTDVTEMMAVADPRTRTYGVVACDFDGDGRPDLFIANDATPCSLYHNEAGKQFAAQMNSAWVAENRGSMGLAIGDPNLDGQPDIIVTHWLNAPALYRNFVGRNQAKKLRFLDRASQFGLANVNAMVGWATSFVDVDNDGLEDLVQVNGHTNPDPARPGKLLQQPAYLWRMTGPGQFDLVAGSPSDPLRHPRVGRGAAFGDLDLDGICDVVVGCNNEPAELWMGRRVTNAWVAALLVGTESNRNAIGSRITMVQGPRTRVKNVASGESFYGSNARQMRFGLGTDETPVTFRVHWPSGRYEQFAGLPVRHYHRLVEGTGQAVPPSPSPSAAPSPATTGAASPGR